MEKKVSIAIIDDDEALASNLKDILEAEGYCVETVNDGSAGIVLFQEKMFDLALVDIKLPHIPGPELVNKLIRLRPETEYIMITTYATMETAIEAVRQKQVIGYENKPIDMDRLLTLIRQVIRRRRAEEALRESERQYRQLLNHAPAGIFEVDFVKQKFVNVNDVICEYTGYTREEMLSMSLFDILNEDSKRLFSERLAKLFAGETVPETVEFKIRGKDGREFWVLLNSNFLYENGKPKGATVVVHDISTRKQMEEEVLKAKKLESLGVLAGGIAHQFNNALSSITGHSELLEMEYPEDEKIMDYAKAMKQSAHRMAHLTSQLLAYAGGGKYNAQPMSLSELVEGALPLIQHTLDPDIRLKTDLPPDVLNMKMDRTQMQMVLSAIIANSNEAIEPPGRIRISTKNIEVDQVSIKDHPGLKPGPHVCLSIEDNGKGMDKETKERIFEPFFTTHFIGRGLGMASVYGIITNHDGMVSVDSEPGKGTAVTIYLPAISAESKEQGAKAVKQPEVELAIGEGTVLIIEDEEVLVKLFKQILEMLGYRVLEAKTGKEAVELAKTFDGQIDLALLDIKLPDMDGGRVYPLIMEARPDLKVIVCSGYSIDGPAQEILDAGAEGFIQKPFLIAPFAKKIKEVLEGK